MNKPGIIHLLYHLCGFAEVGTVAALISHRPEYDTGAVPVPAYQQALTVKYCCPEALIARKESYAAVSFGPPEIVVYINTAVRLHICFIYHIKTIFIAELIEYWRIGIMGSTYGIDVMPLHLHQVFTHLFHGSNISRIRIAVMAVYAAQLECFTIEFDNTVFQSDTSETNLLTDELAVRLYKKII